jgi:glycosyltransferase involved in cell wall biosynthesis
LLLIGEGPQRGRVADLCQQLGIGESVTFAGSITEAEKNRLLCESKLGISVSYEEGWGLSVTEFLAAGLPVVAYALPVFDEVFPGQLQTVRSHDQTAMVERIVNLLRNNEQRESLGARGRNFVSQYDYRAMAQAELDHLALLLNSNPGL